MKTKDNDEVCKSTRKIAIIGKLLKWKHTTEFWLRKLYGEIQYGKIMYISSLTNLTGKLESIKHP